jgi:catechol 2,3-dioxygenase-like lactoylglutathione lyase family enzyme
MQLKFDCVFYYVSDLRKAIRFYRDVLGMRLLSEDVVARFDVDGILFEVVPTHDKSKLQGHGNARFCLQVEDMRQALTDLQAKGVETTSPEVKDGGVLSSFKDPDGNEICLWQYSTEKPKA